MIALEANHITAAFSYIGGAIKHMQIGRTEMLRQGQSRMNLDGFPELLRAVISLQEASEAMALTAAAAAAKRAHETVMNKYSPRHGYDLNSISPLIDALSYLLHAFGDELKVRTVIALSLRYGSLYRPSEPIFGETVEFAFPNASEDISEAGKCLAVEQSTATVFHLMRAMEVAVRVLSARLSISNCEREWGKLLSDMTQKIELMPKGDERDK